MYNFCFLYILHDCDLSLNAYEIQLHEHIDQMFSMAVRVCAYAVAAVCNIEFICLVYGCSVSFLFFIYFFSFVCFILDKQWPSVFPKTARVGPLLFFFRCSEVWGSIHSICFNVYDFVFARGGFLRRTDVTVGCTHSGKLSSFVCRIDKILRARVDAIAPNAIGLCGNRQTASLFIYKFNIYVY